MVTKHYPLTQVVLGDLDDFELLQNQAAKAKIVLEAGSKASDTIKTVIIAPPTIYAESTAALLTISFAGNGRGPVSGRGRQVYELSKLVLTKQYAPILGDGKARWNNVHVHDLSELDLLLTEAAVQGHVDQKLWGDRGYLIVENGEHVWSDLARAVGRAAADLGYLQSCETTAFTNAQALETAGFEAVSWGLNSRARGVRASKVLGWKPQNDGIFDELNTIVKAERGCNGFKLAGLLGEMIHLRSYDQVIRG